ncbi:MAG: tetratricopeptide repeat protein [Marinoscillum sp.]|uniref:tetratricopeptide repeat protein n=1 Tax=Marinoscillum sp. TaxID=2024838 RepID=UPI00330342FD
MRTSIFTLILVALSWGAQAQETLSNIPPDKFYDQGLDAFQQEAYGAAKNLFAQYLALSKDAVIEADYYLAIAALRSGDSEGVSKLLTFIRQEPLHPLAGSGYYVLGSHFFAKNDHEEALKYFTQVSGSQLNARDEEAWRFRQGYSYLETGNQAEAESNFEAVQNYRGSYFNESSYYLGGIYFDRGDYNQALSVLEALDGLSTPYADEVTMMIAGIYFHTNRYAQLYKYAGAQVSNKVSEKNKQLNKLLGEAYFGDKKYTLAASYLQKYLDMSGSRADAETFYKLGFAYFQTGENLKAIENFKKAGLEKGAMGHISSFYLGQLYLKEQNLNYAYSAFKTVAKSTEDDDMREESAFTIGKINFQRAQYAEAIVDFTAFIDQFPNSRWKVEANELLAQAYLKTSNYDQAIAHLESIKNKSLPLKKAYQKVTFQKGQLLFNDSRFQQALLYFDKSTDFPIDTRIAAQAYYLKGECHTILNQSGQAGNAYRKSIESGDPQWAIYSNYGLGYVFYNDKAFDKAEGYFLTYIRKANPTDDFYQDALVRVADCYYVQKKYDQAIRAYSEVTDPQYVPYVTYQMGLVYRLKGDEAKAQNEFGKALRNPRSGYGDKALFQLADMKAESGDFQGSITHINRLLSDYPESTLVPYAKSQQALSHFNLGQYQESRKAYEYVLENHLSHQVANSALLGLQELVKKGVDIPDFDTYMEAYQKAHPDDNSLEVVAFEAAKGAYYNQKYGESIEKLKAFMAKYPNSPFKEDALYFLADSYYRNENWQQATDGFGQVIAIPGSAYISRSLDKRGKALVNLGQFSQAINNYHLLGKRAVNQKETFQAHEGLMNTYVKINQPDSTLYFADQILTSDYKPANAEASAWLVKGKIYLQKKNYNLAVDELLKVMNDSKNESGVEATYLLGRVYFEQGKSKRSLEVLFDLNRSFGSYPYWIGKSFLLIADNYLAMGELLQARATVESIIANATIPEIRKEASQKLMKIKNEESKLLVSDTIKTDSIK